MSSAPSVIPSLDGLRAVSILIVFAAHAGVAPLIPGGFGVTVFFFLSGFLITTLLIREHHMHGSISIRGFYLRRLVRLGPPLLITLAFAALLATLGLAAGDLAPEAILSHIFFFSNYLTVLVPEAGNNVVGLDILWSLAVEEHFYLVYPWVFMLLMAGAIGLRSFLVVLAAVLLWRAVNVFVIGTNEWDIYIRTDTRIDSLLYGCVLALLVERGQARRLFADRFMVPLLIVAGGVLVLTFVLRDPSFRSTLRYTLQGLALMPIFYFAVLRHEHWLFRPLNWKPMRRLGQYSYTLYLVHFVIIEALILNGVAPDSMPLFVLIAAVLSVGYAALVFEYVEKPLKPLRQRLTGH
jgi:peptidoglycan/LPS O-acetylase OafA/YrhL